MLRLICTSLLAAIFSTLAYAQSAPVAAPESPLNVVLRALSASCPGAVQQIVSRGEVTVMFASRPADVQGICECTQTRLLADEKLVHFLGSHSEKPLGQFNMPQFKAYVALRTAQAMFACMATDFDATLAVAPIQ